MKVYDLGDSEEWPTAAVAATWNAVLTEIRKTKLGKMLARKRHKVGVEVRQAPPERYLNGIGP